MTAATASRPFVVAANWKMNLLGAAASEWLLQLLAGLERRGRAVSLPQIVVFPPFPYLERLSRELAARSPRALLRLGGQDLHWQPSGAFTGSVSGAMLRDAGCTDVLCGHSERRHGLAEGDELVAGKVAAALVAGLRPVVCVGETLDERDAGQTKLVLRRQLAPVLPLLRAPTAGEPAPALFAYEPVWAIGTGRTASPPQARAAHAYLRGLLASAGLGREQPILYGGSVNRQSAPALARESEIDGFLVGSAGLDPHHFLDIIRCSGLRL